MEANSSSPTSQQLDTALAANAGVSQTKQSKEKTSRDVKCLLGHFGHTDE